MKNIFSFFLFLSFIIILSTSCKKSSDKSDPPVDPIAALKKSLTNNSTKAWKFSKYFLNNNQQTLNQGQLAYVKTFKMDGNWNDSDGYSGTYVIETAQLLKESTVVGGSGIIYYRINFLNDNILDIEYTFNSNTYRYVYVP